MKIIGAFAVFLALTAGFAFAASTQPPGPEVVVAAVANPNIPDLLRPAPDRPVYYILTDAHRPLGEPVADTQTLQRGSVQNAVVLALASQGYVRTKVGGPVPSLFILVAWGRANFVPPPVAEVGVLTGAMSSGIEGVATSERTEILRAPPIRWDEVELAQLFSTFRRFTMAPTEAARLWTAFERERQYVSLLAYDAQAWRQNRREFLWRTSMSVDGRHALADVLPVMLASGAPYVGYDSERPVFIDDRARREASVRIGEVVVVSEKARP